MDTRYAYLGIGVVMLLAILAFVNPSFMRGRDTDTSGTIRNSSATSTMTLSLTSPAFGEGASIPSQFTCDGNQKSPPLAISGAPDVTKSFAIIVEDPDVPKVLKPDGVFLHWVVFNLPGGPALQLEEGTALGVSGQNGAGQNGYKGPCPPAEYMPNEHRYVFTLYAIDSMLSLSEGASKEDVLHAMQGHILEQAQLMGKYKRK